MCETRKPGSSVGNCFPGTTSDFDARTFEEGGLLKVKRERTNSEEFSAGDWISRLADALPRLDEVQQSFLQEYWERNPSVHIVSGGLDSKLVEFPLDDLRDLYAMASHSHAFGEREYFAPLCAALDPVRHLLMSHPTLAGVIGPIIGRDNFYMHVLRSGQLTSPSNLVAGLMARAAELSGDCLQAATELNAFLAPCDEGSCEGVPNGLDIGYHAVLFYGLTLTERIDVTDGITLLPFEQLRAFVDNRLVEELAPPGGGFHDWRSIGAAVRPFRWKPTFRPSGHEGDFELYGPRPFFREAQTFLDLLGVAHATPVLCLAALAYCIDRSAGRLLGGVDYRGAIYRARAAQGFDGFDECPGLAPEAFAEAKEAFDNRASERYGKMAPIIGRLAEALARDGRFAVEDRILDVAIALERMYELDGGEISHKLRTRAAWFLGADAESRVREIQAVKAFYEARSAIVHSKKKRPAVEKQRAAFDKGFDVARRSLFRLLRDGPPNDWERLVIAGS